MWRCRREGVVRMTVIARLVAATRALCTLKQRPRPAQPTAGPHDCLPSVRSPLFRGCAAKNWEKRLTFLTNANTVLYAVRTESMSCTCLIVTQQFAGGNIKCQAKLNLVFLPLSTTRQGQPAVRKLPMQHITIYLMSYHVKWINFYQIKLICCI